jgi:MarR family transcriptional regulator, organic hydroperoxide resistance regulator
VTATGGKRLRRDAATLEGFVILELQRTTHVAGLKLEALLTEVGVSQGEAHILALLADGSSHTVGDLQRGLGHRPSTLSGILDRLEARRFIRRTLNQADRRSLLISLTRSGRLAAHLVADALRTVERDALVGVARRDIAGFYTVAHALAG